MVTCRKLVEQLCDYLSGEMSEERRQALMEHLAKCPSCRALTDTYQKTVQVCKLTARTGLPPYPGRRLYERLRKELAGE